MFLRFIPATFQENSQQRALPPAAGTNRIGGRVWKRLCWRRGRLRNRNSPRSPEELCLNSTTTPEEQGRSTGAPIINGEFSSMSPVRFWIRFNKSNTFCIQHSPTHFK